MFTDLIIGFDGYGPARDALALAQRLASTPALARTVMYVRSPRGLRTEQGTAAAS